MPNKPFSSDDNVVIDPERKSTAFVVYDGCYDSRSCPAGQDNLKAIFRDFGAVLLSNVLPPTEQRDKARWNDFLQFARGHIDAACCVSLLAVSPSLCGNLRVLKDVCPRLRYGTM